MASWWNAPASSARSARVCPSSPCPGCAARTWRRTTRCAASGTSSFSPRTSARRCSPATFAPTGRTPNACSSTPSPTSATPSSPPRRRCSPGWRRGGRTCRRCRGPLPPAPSREEFLLRRARELQRERDRYRAEAVRLRERAGTDPLTGLPDRSGLAGRVDTAIWDARVGDDALAVVFVDVDCVPAITTLWGHAAGDELLCTVAHRLRGRLRRRDVLARLGGHEFLVGLLDLDPATAATEARRIAAELAEVVRRPMRLRDTEVPVGVRVGVSVFPGDGGDFDELLRAAAQNRYEHRPARARG
ncbi:MAG: GGDEF domain-containing protein [Kineosporiaceae bacterium]